MEVKTIYVVVRYPKRINVWDVKSSDFHIYSKQSSNLEVMRAYFREIKIKHSNEYFVHLMSREKAEKMANKWHDKYCKQEKETAEMKLDKQLDNIYAKYAFHL